MQTADNVVVIRFDDGRGGFGVRRIRSRSQPPGNSQCMLTEELWMFFNGEI